MEINSERVTINLKLKAIADGKGVGNSLKEDRNNTKTPSRTPIPPGAKRDKNPMTMAAVWIAVRSK
jgi:hypothetical protein